MNSFNRRSFLKASGTGLLPVVLPFSNETIAAKENTKSPTTRQVQFFADGEVFDSADSLSTLAKVQETTPIVRDRYAAGGVVEELEKKFVEITGKEKAIMMPSGTMANELAIAVLSGDKQKVFVQDASHVYRDEADSAQTVHGKRLMPLAKDAAYFTAKQLEDAITQLPQEEAFKTGIGAVSVECPVRRGDGRVVPIEEIRAISAYCRKNDIKLHLDGARLFIASGYTGISIKEYASYFDTVYISLYKYFGATGGAILSGPKEIIDRMPHLIKVHGGLMYGNWFNAAMALHRLQDFETRFKSAINASEKLFAALNKTGKVNIKPLDGGTNVFSVQLAKGINGETMHKRIFDEFNIRFRKPDASNQTQFWVNETILHRPVEELVRAFNESMKG